jgi:hypothetical protein
MKLSPPTPSQPLPTLTTRPSFKNLAYGALPDRGADTRLYRLERGWPRRRAGTYLTANPQFKSQPVISQNSANTKMTTKTLTQVLVSYPLPGTIKVQ